MPERCFASLYLSQDSCYVLPPVWYPHGEGWAVKMGHGKAFEQVRARKRRTDGRVGFNLIIFK